MYFNIIFIINRNASDFLSIVFLFGNYRPRCLRCFLKICVVMITLPLGFLVTSFHWFSDENIVDYNI